MELHEAEGLYHNENHLTDAGDLSKRRLVDYLSAAEGTLVNLSEEYKESFNDKLTQAEAHIANCLVKGSMKRDGAWVHDSVLKCMTEAGEDNFGELLCDEVNEMKTYAVLRLLEATSSSLISRGVSQSSCTTRL